MRVLGSGSWNRAIARTRAAFAFASVLGLLAAVESRARADERTEARRHVVAGERDFGAQRYDDAIEHFRRAQAILPHPFTLGRLASAYYRARRFEEARATVEDLLANGPPPDVEEEMRRMLRAIEARERAAAATSTPPPPSPPAEEGPAEPSTPPHEDERAALRDLADEIDAFAAETERRLAERSRRLRALAESSEAGEEAEAPPAAESSSGEETTSESHALATLSETSMAEAETAYDEAIASASRSTSSTLEAPVSTTILSRQDIRMSGATSVPELLRRVAGVNVMTPTPWSSNVAIRGFNRFLSPRVLMLVNGRTTYIDALGVPFWDFQPLMVEDIERVEIIRGPASALYGANGFSGIVNVILRAPGGRTMSEASVGAGNRGVLRGNAAVSGHRSFARSVLEYRVRAGLQRGDRFALAFDPDRVDRMPPIDDPARSYEQLYAGLQLTTRFAGDESLSLEAGVAELDRATFYATTFVPDFAGRFSTAHAMITLERPRLRVRTFLNREVAPMRPLNGLIEPSDLTNHTFDTEAEYHRRFVEHGDHDVHLGLSVRHQSSRWNYLEPGERRQQIFGAFGEYTLRVGAHFLAVGSIRVDRHPLVEGGPFDRHVATSPRLALLVRPRPTRTLRLAYARAFRTPTFLEAFGDLRIDAPTSPAGPNLATLEVRGGLAARGTITPERIDSLDLGFLDQSWSRLGIDVSLFYNRVSRLIVLGTTTASRLAGNDDSSIAGSYLPESDRWVAAVQALTNETATYHVAGTDLTIRSNPVEGLDVVASYSLNLMRRVVPSATATWDRETSRHAGSFVVQYRWAHRTRSLRRLDVSIELDVASAQRWREFDPRVAASTGTPSSLPLPAYYLLHARLAHPLGNCVSVAVSGWNLTGSRRRQHPFAQPVDTRILGTLETRIGDRCGVRTRD